MALAVAQLMTNNLTPVYAAPSASEQIAPAPRQFLHVKNTNASLTNVTIDDKGTSPAGSAVTDPVIVVPATTGDKMIYLDERYTDPVTGNILVAFSNVAAGVVGAVVRLP
jgi:hypothetical protein